MEILAYFSWWVLAGFPDIICSHHSTISIHVGTTWIKERGLSASILEGRALETKIQDQNHTGNYQNTVIISSL